MVGDRLSFPDSKPAGLWRFHVVFILMDFLPLDKYKWKLLLSFQVKPVGTKVMPSICQRVSESMGCSLSRDDHGIGGVAPAWVIKHVFPQEVSYCRRFLQYKSLLRFGKLSSTLSDVCSIKHLPEWSEANPHGSKMECS